jgi:hypothetical protein
MRWCSWKVSSENKKQVSLIAEVISWSEFKRYNGGGQHLNRDFPHIFDSLDEDTIRQPETIAVMSWIHANNFLTSVSYFSGAKVVTFPFDSVPPLDLYG